MTLPIETARFAALKTLAATQFGEISPAEESVLRLSASTEDHFPRALKERHEVRAAFLRWLATDEDAAASIDPLGLRVENATISSKLNLNFCKVPFRLFFCHCILQDEFSLISAELPALYLSDCTVKKDLISDVLRVPGHVSLNDLKAKGMIRLFGAQIGGDLDLAGSSLRANHGVTLMADEARISGGVYLRQKFSSSGALRFNGAQIGVNIECSDATFSGDGVAISAVGANIAGSVYLRGKFGAIQFFGVQIGGDLDCRGATLSATTNALIADRAKISGHAFLRGAFSSSGTIRFNGAQIGGGLDCSGATLTAEGDALTALGAKIARYVDLGDKFCSTGTITFSNAQIGGDLACSGAKMRTLTCQDMRLSGNLIWTAIQDAKTCYLDLSGASINTLRDDTASWPAPGSLVVKGLEYKNLAHDESSTEEHLSNNRTALQRKLDAGERIGWLGLQGEGDRLDPHAWMWLAQLFKEKDDIVGYRQIVCEYRCMKARSLANPTSRSVGILMAHVEKNPWSILWLFLPLLMIGTSVFWWAAVTGKMQPTSADAYFAWASGKPFPVAYPRFNPWVYTLENELPLVKFGMDDKWAPDPNLITRRNANTYWFLACFRWVLILAGWIQGIMLSIGINRRFRD